MTRSRLSAIQQSSWRFNLKLVMFYILCLNSCPCPFRRATPRVWIIGGLLARWFIGYTYRGFSSTITGQLFASCVNPRIDWASFLFDLIEALLSKLHICMLYSLNNRVLICNHALSKHGRRGISLVWVQYRRIMMWVVRVAYYMMTCCWAMLRLLWLINLSFILGCRMKGRRIN